MMTTTLTASSWVTSNTSSCVNTKPVKLALFGIGRWGTHWFRKFLEHPQAQLVAVVDPCSDRLQTFARQYELARYSMMSLSDWQTALDLPGLEAVAIVTPAATHAGLIRAALERQLHVLVEKPLTLDAAESLNLCHLAASQQRQLLVDHTYLFHPAVQRGRVVVQQGELGQLRYGYAARTHLGPVRQDVDALWDLAIHDIAIFNHWLGAMPVQVQAQGNHWLQNSSATPGLADLVWIKLTYANGFEAVVHLCWSNPDKQRRLTLVGSQAALVFNELAEAPLTLFRGGLDQQAGQFVPQGLHHQTLAIEPVEPLQAVCDHFLNCVQTNRASEVSSGWLGAELVRVLAALTESLHQGGRPVSL
jgi:predicted dehydrogenase